MAADRELARAQMMVGTPVGIRGSAPTSPISAVHCCCYSPIEPAMSLFPARVRILVADGRRREIPGIRVKPRHEREGGQKRTEGSQRLRAQHLVISRAAPNRTGVRKKKKRQSRNAPCVNRREYTGNLDVIRTCRAGDRAYNRPLRCLALNWSPLVGADFSPANRRRDCAARRAATPLRVLYTAP